MSCPPRYATRRRPERETFGHELDNVADKLGMPFMPWQQFVSDVGCEIDPRTGLPAYREIVITIHRQAGKALDVLTPILTYNRGWVTMGELRRGDAVYHPDGFPVAVTAVSRVMTGHDCFRVTTVDGRSVVADAEHLWTVTDKRAQRSKGTPPNMVTWFEQRVVTTREMFEGGVSRYAAGGRTSTTGGKKYATNEYRFVLPSQEPIKSPDVALPVDPYLFGAWLGDGTSSSGTLTCHVSEVAHWSAAIQAAGFIPVVHDGGGTADTRSVAITTTRGEGRRTRAFAGRLRQLGVLKNKHVPGIYLTAGTSQREALLQGLCDTDGSAEARRGQVEFCSTNRGLADAVLYLARSLGWRATFHVGRAKLYGKDCGEKYRVCWTPKRADPFVPFRLERKVARIRERDGGKGRATLSIASIEPVESRPVRCIKVDSPDGLFLAGRDLIPTHNTSLLLSWQIHRCVARRWTHPQRSVFTAQTGKDARDKWIDELFPLIRNSKLKTLVAASGRGGLAINEGMGNESVRFKTGSVIRLLSTSAGSGHSKTLHQAVMDEIWHDVDDRREQGLRPAMITKPDAQLLVCSTAGTIESVILNRKIETGRRAVREDSGHGVAYFEWSAPDDWDPDDWDSYFGFMPALCPDPPCRCDPAGRWRHTITLDVLKAERASMDLLEFKRAYGNVMAGVNDLRWQVIPESDWRAAALPDFPRPEQVALSVVVAPDQSMSYICAAGPIGEGLFGVAILDAREGVSWVTERLLERAASLNPLAVVLDRNSAAEQVWLELVAHEANSSWETVKVGEDLRVSITPRDEAAACLAFYNGISGVPSPDPDTGEVKDPRVVRHRSQPQLDQAVAVATKKLSGSTWRWNELASDVSALKGCCEALFGYTQRQPPLEQPWYWDGIS